MVELFSLLRGLHLEERKQIEVSFKKSIDNENLYLEDLYFIMSSSTDELITDQKLSKAVYGQEKLTAITKLKSRLFKFLLEILSSNAIISKEQIFENSAYQIIRVRKKMLQFRVLFMKINRADSSILLHLLSDIIKEAKECEQYDILVEALFFKKTELMIKNGFSESTLIQEQIDLYEYSHKALLKSISYYYELIANQDLASLKSPNEIKVFLNYSIVEMQKFIKITDSAFIKYICKLFQLEQLLKSDKHDDSIEICIEILKLLETHKHLWKKDRIGVVYNNISICQVYKNSFSESIDSAKKALEYYPPDGFNFIITLEQEFIACFYGNIFTQANSIIMKILKYPRINSGKFRYDKYLLFQASTLFKLGEYIKASTICNQALEISKDKSRWDLGLRYLRLACMIELLDYDQAHFAVEALRKIMKRKINKGISLRDDLIYSAFNEFSNASFSRNPSKKLIEIIHILSQKKSVYSWNYYTHELVPIHNWMKSKINLL